MYMRQEKLQITRMVRIEMSFETPHHVDADKAANLFHDLMREWVTTTPEGQEAYRASSCDFNIGDMLCGYETVFTRWLENVRMPRDGLAGFVSWDAQDLGEAPCRSYDSIVHPFGPEDAERVCGERVLHHTFDYSTPLAERAGEDEGDTEDFWMRQKEFFEDDYEDSDSLDGSTGTFHIWFDHPSVYRI